MKKVISSLLFAGLMISCSEKSSPVSPSGNNQTGGDIYIGANFFQSTTTSLLHPIVNGTDRTLVVNVNKGSLIGEDITDATVIFDGKTCTYNSFAGSYITDAENIDYVPGKYYTLSVTVNGTTYIDSAQAPGGISVDSDGSKVSWTYEGNGDWLATFPADDDNHDPLWETTDQANDMVSPVTVPSSAFNLPGHVITLHAVTRSMKFLDKSGLASTANITISDMATTDFQK